VNIFITSRWALQWVETSQSNFCIYPTDICNICISRLMVLCWRNWYRF